MKFSLSILFLFVASFSTNALAFDHTHGVWSTFLKKNVVVSNGGSTSKVKYKSLNLSDLKKYTSTMLKVTKSELNGWTKNQQLAFYFNLYNALTVQIIKENYPISSIKNIIPIYKRIGGYSTWKKPFFKLFGKDAYLDMIEHELVRKSGKYKEPRVHFAFNCASIGCPALLNEAFVASKLENQLESSLKAFLKDKSRNKIANGQLKVSNIFNWYKEDFSKGWGGNSSLKDFFAKYADLLTTNAKV